MTECFTLRDPMYAEIYFLWCVSFLCLSAGLGTLVKSYINTRPATRVDVVCFWLWQYLIMTNGNLLLYSSPTSVPLQPYSNHTEAPLQPYFIPAPALLQPHSSPISNVLQPYFQGYLPVPGRHVMMFLELTERVAGSTTPKPLTPIPMALQETNA